MIHIDEKTYFYLLLLVPLLIFFYAWVQFSKRKMQRQFATKEALKRLAPEASAGKGWLKFGFLALALVCLIVALANPKIGTKIQNLKMEGVDIVFAIDVSKSMLGEDVKPNRLEKAKHLTSEIINQLSGDRIGLVAYAGQAFPQLPLTSDYAAAKMFLHNMNTEMLSSQGTAIDQAIGVASGYFKDERPTSRLIFIISDGEDHQEEASEMVQQVAETGVRIYTIGLGSAKGTTIPIKEGQTQVYKRDQNGEVVITKLNRPLLEEIAKQGGGRYIDGNNTQEVLQNVKNILSGVDKNEYQSQLFSDYKDQFQWFVGAALLLIVIDMFISFRKTPWLRKLNLFGEKK